MYYITNQTNQIIATDSHLLELLSVQNIDELYKKIALDEISFSLTDDKVTITTALNTHIYKIQESKLQSVLGEMHLIHLSNEEVLKEETSFDESLIFQSEIDNETAMDEKDETDLPIIDGTDTEETTPLLDDSSFLKDDSNEEINIDDNELFKDEIEDFETSSNSEDEDLISLIDTDTIDLLETSDTQTDNLVKESEPTVEEDELFDLFSSDTAEAEDKSAKEEEKSDIAIAQDTGPIIIDAESISKEIGISTEDYDNFLNEYIDTALKLEEDLKSDQTEKYSQAITTLSHLSNVLHLPMVTQIITEIENSTGLDRNQHIHTLYSTLTRLTTNKNITILPMDDLPILEEEPTSLDVDIPETFGTINLDDVKPIHFDFQLEEAANDLSLPVELIEEFVHDFIEQAHSETKNMLKAYEKGDLETIQKIGHMLKGASSNLRIKALSETLYKIQFCEKQDEIEDLIKDYWGHFIAFEKQIKLTSQ